MEGKHAHDWPNSAGFQVTDEQRTPVELKTIGSFPVAVAGTLYRTGPASYRAGDFKLSHWFDGFSQVYRFQLIPRPDGSSCQVLYNSRRQVDKQLEKFRQTGQLNGITFGQKRDPCVGFFQKVKAVFSARHGGSASDANINVTIHPPVVGNDGKLEGRTDNAQLKTLDMETLEPVGVTDQSKLHPALSGPLSCAHAQFDPTNGDCYNYNLDFGRFATYRLFKTSAQTGETEILATITGADVPPAYIHSFFLTENFVVLCVWSSHFGYMGLSTLWERNLLDAISPFDASGLTHWFVVDRRNGKGLVKRFSSHAMFCFHTINAYEVQQPDGTTDIIADLDEYPTLDILHRFYYDNLVSDSPGAGKYADEQYSASTHPALARYRLSSVAVSASWNPVTDKPTRAERIMHLPTPRVGELPTINPAYQTKPHRYVYGLCDRGLSSFLDGITKTDMQTQQTLYWAKSKHTPGEAIFVADPARADREDGGWVLSCVLDGEKGTSYLLCLDAEDLREVARAESDVAWGIGFHGTHVAKRSVL